MVTAESDWMRGSLVDLGAVSLWADIQGPHDGEAVILLGGADSPGFRWTPALVEPLLTQGYRVLRFDHRDSARSTMLGPDAAYKLDDLADDAIGLMDYFRIHSAHLIGRSMGGMIAQLIALGDPQRVLSLTLIGTTPGAGDDRLPGPSEEFVDKMINRLFDGPPVDEQDQQSWIVDLYRMMSGTIYPFDEFAQAELARAELATGWADATGHGVAVHSSESRLDRLGSIVAPTLVVHGSVDPVYPLAHGRALAGEIPGAVLIEIDGLGHEFPDLLASELWPVLRLHLRESGKLSGSA